MECLVDGGPDSRRSVGPSCLYCCQVVTDEVKPPLIYGRSDRYWLLGGPNSLPSLDRSPLLGQGCGRNAGTVCPSSRAGLAGGEGVMGDGGSSQLRTRGVGGEEPEL